MQGTVPVLLGYALSPGEAASQLAGPSRVASAPVVTALVPTVATQDGALPPKARGGNRKAPWKHPEREQEEAMWTGGFPKSIAARQTRKREVDRVSLQAETI